MEIDWIDDRTPRSRRFDDFYFARSDGLAESAHVFLAGVGLPERWRGRERFTVAELGFGMALNFLLTLGAWRDDSRAPTRLAYVAFEIDPPAAADLRRAVGRWPQLSAPADELLADWPPPAGWSTRPIGGADLTLAIGDANALLPGWDGAADAWFLDGFSPAKNPDLWGGALLSAVFESTAPDGRFATYAAAGWVRRNLEAAGFDVSRAPGYGAKREMLKGRRRNTS